MSSRGNRRYVVRRISRLAIAVIAAVAAALPAVARADTPPVPIVGPNGLPPVDINYIYSLIDDTNNSTSLTDGKSWLVRYYSRLSGAAGNTQATNPHPCQLNATTGKNTDAVGSNALALLDNNIADSGQSQDCWWELMNAWKATARSLPGMSPDNVTDHFYHLGEVDSNPYVSDPQSLTATQPGPQDTIMLTIPGAVDPQQTVLIGEHPDGASLSTWGSAFDDGQGAAVIMGVAKDMLTYWISHHEWPARTVQFALFDGEEEGLFGSFFYQANEMPVGAVDAGDYVGMFNVDQNGIEYPARHFGTPDKPGQGPWFTNINETPQSDYSFYNENGQPYPRLLSNHTAIAAFHDETYNAINATFGELGQMYAGKPMPLANYGYNYAGLYPSDCMTSSSLPATDAETGVNCVDTFQDPADLRYFLAQDDTLGRTDQDPFIRCGIPAWGILGAYDTNAEEPVNPDPEPFELPYAGYDTPTDNVAWLNYLASGHPYIQGPDMSPPNEINPTTQIGSEALRRALSFAGDLVLNEATDPNMAGVAPTPTDPIAYFQADRYGAKVGEADTFTAIPSPIAATSWVWSFGDGQSQGSASPTVSHAWAQPGVYTVTLTETGPGGSSTYSASVHVVGAKADANTVCGQVDNPAEYAPGNDTQWAPTFTNSPTQ
jgi:hypothetical protein